MKKILSLFTIWYLGLGLAMLPTLFIYYDLFVVDKPPTRLFIISQYQIFAILLFAMQGFRHSLTTAMRPIMWALIAILIGIAYFKIAFDIGHEKSNGNRSIMWLLHILFAIGAISTLRILSARQILTFMLAAFGVSVMIYMTTVLAIEFRRNEVDVETCSTALPGFGNVRYTGYFAAFAYVFFLSSSAQIQISRSLRMLCFLSAVVSLFFIIYTGSRGAIAASGIAILINAAMLGRQCGRLLIPAAITAIIAALAISLISPHPCPAYNAFARVAATPELTVEKISTGRTAVWLTSFELFKERPFFGQGEIRLWKQSDLWVTQAHNSVLQSLMTWGIVGASCFWTLVFALATKVYNRTKSAPLTHLPYTSAILCMLAYSMIDATLYYSYPLLLTTFAIIAIFASAKPATFGTNS